MQPCWRTDHCADEKPPDIPSGASFCGGKTSAGHCTRRLVQPTLREIATKIASEYLGEGPHPPSVYPSFIEEPTRLRTNAGVSRQKLASTPCPGRGAARLRCAAEPGPMCRQQMDPGSAAHHAARHSASKPRVNALMALRSIRRPVCLSDIDAA